MKEIHDGYTIAAHSYLHSKNKTTNTSHLNFSSQYLRMCSRFHCIRCWPRRRSWGRWPRWRRWARGPAAGCPPPPPALLSPRRCRPRLQLSTSWTKKSNLHPVFFFPMLLKRIVRDEIVIRLIVGSPKICPTCVVCGWLADKEQCLNTLDNAKPRLQYIVILTSWCLKIIGIIPFKLIVLVLLQVMIRLVLIRLASIVRGVQSKYIPLS